MGVRVGIPRALWYYTYFPFWREFFTGLDVTCVLSGVTTKGTLDMGVAGTVSEACVPIKLFFGHIKDLLMRWEHGEIDALFIPRYTNWHGKTVFCPKFLGLPDMVRHSYAKLPPLISPRIDRRSGLFAIWRVCNEIRLHLGASFVQFWNAYKRAWRVQRQHEKRLRANWDANTSIRGKQRVSVRNHLATKTNICLAVLGYPYLIYDSYISLDLVTKLQAMGVKVITAEALQARHRRRIKHWAKALFWTYSDMVARAGVYALSAKCTHVDGVIHVTAFGCGPDATVDKLLELEARRVKQKPFLSLCLDEQTGEAGCLTRLEAFVDMLRRKNASA